MPCNNNCNQGRQCDCVPDLPIQFAEDDGYGGSMAEATYALIAMLILAFAAGFAVGYLVG